MIEDAYAAAAVAANQLEKELGVSFYYRVASSGLPSGAIFEFVSVSDGDLRNRAISVPVLLVEGVGIITDAVNRAGSMYLGSDFKCWTRVSAIDRDRGILTLSIIDTVSHQPKKVEIAFELLERIDEEAAIRSAFTLLDLDKRRSN